MRLSLHSNFCARVHSKRETCLKTDSRVFSEEISLKQDNLLSKSSSSTSSTLHWWKFPWNSKIFTVYTAGPVENRTF